MSRRTVPLSAEHLADLAAREVPCASDLFWELDPVRRGRVGPEAAQHKQRWVRETTLTWGTCGQALVVDGSVLGFLTYAPWGLLPGAAAFPTAPPAVDAVVLAAMYVDPEHLRSGLGRVLVQAMARDLVHREECRAIETFARSGAPVEVLGLTDPVLPQAFLERVGFEVVRAHPTRPRMRLDLRSTITWFTEVGAAWEGLLGVIRPQPARPPEPSPQREVLTRSSC